MIKEKEQVFRRLLMALDILTVLAAFFAAFIFRQNVHAVYKIDIFPGRQLIDELRDPLKYFNILPVILFTWWASLSASGLYESFRRKSFFEIAWGIIKSAFLTITVT